MNMNITRYNKKVFNILGQKHPLVSESLSGVNTPGRNKPTPQVSPGPGPGPAPVASVILLQLETGYVDKQALQTYQYYWNKYPNVWKSTIVVDTNIDINDPTKIYTQTSEIIENNNKFMSYYYNLGCRLFIGFTTSGILAGALNWFAEHPDALGISLTSSSPLLSFPKPVYRLQPTDSLLLQPLIPILDNAPQIIYFYSINQNASEALKVILQNLYGNKLYLYAVEDDSSNLSQQQIQNFYNNISGGLSSNAVTLIYLYIETQLEDYVNVYSENFKMPNNNYDITISSIIINENAKPGVVNKFFVLSFGSASTSLMFREGIEDLNENFNSAVPNALLLQNFLITYGKSQINTISAQDDILEFNENNDLKYFSVLTVIYSLNDNIYSFEKLSLYIKNPVADGITIYF